MTHYRLMNEFLFLLRSIEEGGELTDEQLVAAEMLGNHELPALMNQYAALLRELTMGEANARQEAAWFTGRARGCARSAEILKGRMVSLMRAFQQDVVETNTFRVKLCVSPPSVVPPGDDFKVENLVGSKWEGLVAKVEYKLDAKSVKEMWEQGGNDALPPGLAVKSDGNYVKITPR